MKTFLLAMMAFTCSSCVVANVHARFYKGELHQKMTCIFEAGGPGVLPEAKCGPPEIMELLSPSAPERTPGTLGNLGAGGGAS